MTIHDLIAAASPGPCPPMYRPRASGQSRIYSKLVTSEYAEWQRRRAERAEALLRRCVPLIQAHGFRVLLLDDIAAHFAEVKP